MYNIIFIAPPAAGKGTLSRMLHEKYLIPHISMGDILRKKVLEDTEEALQLKLQMEQGNLISDDYTNKLMKERLSEGDTQYGFILDGYPRTIYQAKALEQILSELNKVDYTVIYLDVKEKVALERILGRVICPKCHKVYNKFNKATMPKIEGICDNCGTWLTSRSDDTEEAFKTRFETYLKETEPLIEYYKEKGILHEVNGDNDPDVTFKKVDKILNGEQHD